MIGIFDSGLGGLTVLQELRKQAPQADVVYFGDTRNAPYGNRTMAELGALTAIGIQKLITEGADDIVTACNTVSVQIVEPMFDILQVSKTSIVEMVGPTAEYTKSLGGDGILIVAAKATVGSGLYQESLIEQGVDEEKIHTVSLPELAGAIESGAGSETIAKIIKNGLSEVVFEGFDVCVLACTHYPLVQKYFFNTFNELDKVVTIINPAVPVVREMVARFDTSGSGHTRFILSSDSGVFRNKVIELGINNCVFDIVEVHG